MNKTQEKIVNEKIILLDKKDIQQLTNWGKNTIDKIFAYDKSFPAIKVGKKYQVEVGAFLQYLRIGRE